MSMQQLVKLCMDNILRLHGTRISLVSDRDTRFTSCVRKVFQDVTGTKLKFRIDFYPQTNGQSERTIQVLEDLLRSCVLV